MPMRFIKLDSQISAEQILYDEINNATKHYNNIAWFISGGSNIKIATDVSRILNQSQLSKLTVLLSDERFGKVDHLDSNNFQLKQAGFDFGKVKSIPTLNSDDSSLEEAATKYQLAVEKVFKISDYTIGQIGIGTDGHILGILPNSPAVNEDSKLVTSYVGADFPRITLSFKGFKMISKVLVFALGKNKKEAITNLANKDLSLNEEPAQICKQLKDVYIINDIIGGDI